MYRLCLLLGLLALPAQAYPWMVRHNYGSCAVCHVDPSGAGQLTQYGRAQNELLVRWQTQPPKEDDELPTTANFLWFAELPEWLNLSGNLRYGSLIRPQAGPTVVGGIFIPLLMAVDVYATVNIGPVVLHASTGIGIRSNRNTGPAQILPLQDAGGQSGFGVQWLAREFWAGFKLADDAVMMRIGRNPLPFGLRNNEHTSYVRSFTRTDFNVHQQVGATVSYNGEKLRGEAMGIAGNFQIGPDVYRERGYSAFAEYAFTPAVNIGVSSLITAAGADYVPPPDAPPGHTVRQAHGLFARLAPVDKLAVLMEADFLMWQYTGNLDRFGMAAFAQGDYEVVRGLHLMLTAETAWTGVERGAHYGAWLSAAWYFFSHCELRIDNIFRRNASTTAPGEFEYSLLLQLHAYL